MGADSDSTHRQLRNSRSVQILSLLESGFLGGTALFVVFFFGWLFDVETVTNPENWVILVIGALLLLSTVPAFYYGVWNRHHPANKPKAETSPSQDERESRRWTWVIATSVLIGSVLIGIELLFWHAFRSLYFAWWGIPIPVIIGGGGSVLCSILADYFQSTGT